MSTNLHQGLSIAEVESSRNTYGANVLTPPKRDPWYVLLLEKFKDKLIIILSVAAIFATILGVIKQEFAEPIGIICAILLAVGLGFWNEYSASRKFDILNQVSDDTLVKVRRNGILTQVSRKDLVVGDIVLLEAGEEIPADIEIISSTHLKVDESTLTGESVPVSKNSPEEGHGHSTYPKYLLLRGTTIAEGGSVGVITAVGDRTEFGKTARKAAEITDTETPLNKQLDGLAGLINKIAIGSATFLITALLCRYFFIEVSYVDKDWIQITNDLLSFVMIAVALIVVAVPEGLPMAVTLSLAYSMKRMSAANNLVRKMHACETLGATTLIFTDKTGTLTENNMKVVVEKMQNNHYIELNCLVNSTATIGQEGKIIGNPTEGAILKHCKTGTAAEAARIENPIVFRVDFSSKTKFMMTVIKNDDSFLSLMKGAPEVVEQHCSARFEGDIAAEQIRGRRVIGFAYKESTTIEEAQTVRGFEPNGYMAIEDPIRSDVPHAIEIARAAGIKVKVITGDNSATATEIATQAGISRYPVAMDTSNIGDVTQGLYIVDVFSRAKPEDKQILVQRFQDMGEVVAMTGDGTNDAPALNHAHVGIAMNNGTDVAKESADIILLDNSFPSIVMGVKWGRSLYKNIQHFILFQLTINVVAVLTACVGPFIGIDLPFTVTQMLWVNLIMDTFAALALATEPANDAVMLEKPRDPNAFIITHKMWYDILGKGIIFFILCIAMLLMKLPLTVFFTSFVMLQWWNLFDARVFGQQRSIFDGLLKNPMFGLIVLGILVGQILIVQFGGDVFRTEPLALNTWLTILGATSLVVVVREGAYQISKLIKK